MSIIDDLRDQLAYERHKVSTLEASLSALTARNERLTKALAFYRDNWKFKTLKNRPGLEWSPTEALLDDCGNKAKDALSDAQGGRKENGDG